MKFCRRSTGKGLWLVGRVEGICFWFFFGLWLSDLHRSLCAGFDW